MVVGSGSKLDMAFVLRLWVWSYDFGGCGRFHVVVVGCGGGGCCS